MSYYVPNNLTGLTDIDFIKKYICVFRGMDESAVFSKNRDRELTYTRQLVVYYLRRQLGLTWQRCADALDVKDHTTAIYCFDKIKDLFDVDESVREDIKHLDAAIMTNDNQKKVLAFLNKIKDLRSTEIKLEKAVKAKEPAEVRKLSTDQTLLRMDIDAKIVDMIKICQWHQTELF